MDLLGLWHYWVVIILMMIGLYIVIARDNLVKKVMGLNIFQVSVIMFYVSIGKVKGGTAPILTGTLPSGHGEGHGDGHSEGAGHGAAAAHEAGHGAAAAHDAGHGDAAAHDAGAGDAGHGVADGHASSTDAVSEGVGGELPVCIEQVCPEGLYGMWDATQQACECAAFSNPLPHVLMLTAIVVGVATTALGLALIVRIQEAYGTVEEDEIIRINREESA